MAFATSSSLSSDINVTPLIDVLLVLLIIFMVVAPIAPRGMDSSIPHDKPVVSSALPPVVLRLLSGKADRTAEYEISRQRVAPESVIPRLRAAFAVRENRTIFIEADRALSYREVAGAVSDAREAGAGAVVVSGLR